MTRDGGEVISPDSSGGMTRRRLMMNAGAGLITIAALPTLALSDVDSYDCTLDKSERKILSAFGETLLPGAAKAGIVRYVEQQLKTATPLLFLRYMDYTEDSLAFYRTGLRALDAESIARFGTGFTELTGQQQADLVSSLSQSSPADWQGPPAPLFYFVIRNDATDVLYGTQEGFRKLDVPYMALIVPPRKW